MARCCGSTCACKISPGTHIGIVGTGTPQDPFLISGDLGLVANDNTTFDVTVSGAGTSSSPWSIDVGFAASAKLNDLPDVNAPDPDDGNVLSWDSATARWISVPPVTAPPGAVTTDDSLDGDGSLGNPLEVREDPDRFLDTSAAGLGISSTGINQMVRKFSDATARAAAVPAPSLNTLSVLASNPGAIQYWDGLAWVNLEAGFNLATSGALLELSGPYVAGLKVTVFIKQISGTTNASGDLDLLTPADLASYAGVLSCVYQPTGTGPVGITMVRGNTDRVTGRFFSNAGPALAAVAVTGTVVSYLY
jgi:hypothetical protein